MNGNSTQPAMSRKIFTMDLDVEAVSLYLLCCALADAGTTITRETLAQKWNGNGTGLDRELRRLEERQIIAKNAAAAGQDPSYGLTDEDCWR
jgi:hypothetical protein